ncbi:MAG: hypothetical protein AABZ84_03480 [Pseudomonadota bacterium]
MKQLDERLQRTHDDQISVRQPGIVYSHAGSLLQVDDEVFAAKLFPTGTIADLKNRRSYIRKVSDSDPDCISESSQNR